MTTPVSEGINRYIYMAVPSQVNLPNRQNKLWPTKGTSGLLSRPERRNKVLPPCASGTFKGRMACDVMSVSANQNRKGRSHQPVVEVTSAGTPYPLSDRQRSTKSLSKAKTQQYGCVTLKPRPPKGGLTKVIPKTPTLP